VAQSETAANCPSGRCPPGFVCQCVRIDNFPGDAFAGVVTMNADLFVLLPAIETFDRVRQTTFRILIGFRRQWIADPFWPDILLEGAEDVLLIDGTPLKPLDDRPVQSQYSHFRVPLQL